MAQANAPAASAVGKKPLFSENYKSAVLSLLVIVYTLNFIDRTIIATIGQAIKEDLKITDAQLGLLGGLAFALLYTTLGIPIARLAERYSRVNIISICVAIWSLFTALSGTAVNFVTLLLYRVGVGIGEAGCSPPAHSLISDYYPPKQRATALSVYAFGIPLGSMIAAIAGGYIVQYLDWRYAFLLVGAPGLLIALAVRAFIKEPPRGHSEHVDAVHLPEEATPEAHNQPFSLWWEFKELAIVARRIFGKPAFLHMTLGVTIISFVGYGTGQFSQPYFLRNFTIDYATVGLVFGVIGGVSQGAGTLLGGYVTDRLASRSPAWYGLVPAIGLAIALPIYLIAFTTPDWKLTALILLVPGIFHYLYLGPTFGVIQNSVETRRRATATALLFFFLNLIALGFGPPFTGWLIDQFAQYGFTHPGQNGLVSAFFGLFSDTSGASYTATCPGGKAPSGSAADLVALCRSVSGEATRQGILVTLLLFAWGALHYLLASFTLARDLKSVGATLTAK